MTIAADTSTCPAVEPVFASCVRDALDRHGLPDWRIRPAEFWCSVHPLDPQLPTQGWKLHLSATPVSAPLVLARAVEVLARYRCVFKFAATVERVAELGAGNCDRGSGGKFITVYPDLDEDGLRALAAELHESTIGLPGPGVLSDRRYRPGSLVHYRYGAFAGQVTLGNDGCYLSMLVAPDGEPALDQRNPWFWVPPWAPPDPFGPAPGPAKPTGNGARPVRLNGRFVVHKAVRHTFKGGVFRARDEHSGNPVVIKQARAHTGSATEGGDTQHRLRHEAAVLAELASTGVAARPVELFEHQGDLFLAEQEVAGSTLRSWALDNLRRGADEDWGPPVDRVLRIARSLVDAVAVVHGLGWVLRDCSPGNVVVDPDDRAVLIDLEMLAPAGRPVGTAHTPGYGAPEQVGAPPVGRPADPAADLFSLGATLFYLSTGVHPILSPDVPEHRSVRERIAARTALLAERNPAMRRLAPTVLALMDDRPEHRPDLATVRRILDEPAADPIHRAPAPLPPPLDRLIDDGLRHTLATLGADDDRRLWPPPADDLGSDPVTVQHGAAGVLAVLTRAYQADERPELRAAIARVARWTRRAALREPRLLPGLYFGRAGTAWALLEAGLLLGDDATVHAACDLARRIPVRWPNPDICHGTAGAGLTQLHFWARTGDPQFLARADAAAAAVAEAAEWADGRLQWRIPADFRSGLAGLRHWGYAHGVAGIGTFLLAAGRAGGEQSYLELADAAAETLEAVALRDGDAATWPSGESNPLGLAQWCSGAAGVGTFLLRLWRERGDERWLALSRQAATAVRRSRFHVGTSHCCGSSGQGEFLLDMAGTLGERYHDWATEIASVQHTQHTVRGGRLLVPDQVGVDVVVDYGRGLAGVLAFLLRLRHGGPRMWLPAGFEREEVTTHGVRRRSAAAAG